MTARRTGYFSEIEARKMLAQEVESYGGVRAFARKHGFSAAYVSDVVRGNRGLSQAILKILSLEKFETVTYHRVYP